MSNGDPFKGLNDLNAGIQRQAELVSNVAREIDEANEAKYADAERKHAEVVKATTDLAALLDDVAGATIGVAGAVKHVEGAVRHVEDAVDGMRREVREALIDVTTAVDRMNAATSRLMWVSIGVAALAILATVLLTIFT